MKSRPWGFCIVSGKTGNVHLLWVLLDVALGIWAVVSLYNGYQEGRPLSSCMPLFFLCGTIAVVLFLVRCTQGVTISRYNAQVARIQELTQRLRDVKTSARSDAAAFMRDFKNKELSQAKIDAARDFESLVASNKGIPIVQGGVPCKRNEAAVFYESDVELSEQTSEAGRRVWKNSDRGCLQITNKRILFCGRHQNKEIQIRNVVTVRGFLDGVTISTSDRVKPVLFKSRNGLLIIKVVEVLLDNPEMPLLPENLVARPKPSKCADELSKNFIQSLSDASLSILSAVKEMHRNPKMVEQFKLLDEDGKMADMDWFVCSDPRICVAVVIDLVRCYMRLGHQVDDLTTREGVCLLMVLGRLFRTNRTINDAEWTDKAFCASLDRMYEPYMTQIDDLIPFGERYERLLTCDILLAGGFIRMSKHYAAVLYEWARLVSIADGALSVSEGEWLGLIKTYSRGIDPEAVQDLISAME